MNKFASLCVLSYKRPDKLKECLDSILIHADYPYELIVNIDGGDKECSKVLNEYWYANHISKLIMVNGNNRGVGVSQANCFKLAEGDYIFKIDTDLTFQTGFMSRAIRILEEDDEIGAVSMFDYRFYDPEDQRFNKLENRNYYHIVDDFVSSIYAFRSEDLFETEGEWSVDDGFHQYLKNVHGKLAITAENLAFNSGFGIGNSVYVTGTMDNPRKTQTFDEPLIFKK